MNVTGMYRSVLTMPVAAPASWPMPLVVTLRITVGGAYPANVTATKTLWLLWKGDGNWTRFRPESCRSIPWCS
ncbi:hypothetical protein BDZ88DRAFT_428994 [Geranomyces variabilis]|nr:hypothetical protein BDZ88DRAFT_428994 [Geranomyces variabilis]